MNAKFWDADRQTYHEGRLTYVSEKDCTFGAVVGKVNFLGYPWSAIQETWEECGHCGAVVRDGVCTNSGGAPENCHA